MIKEFVNVKVDVIPVSDRSFLKINNSFSSSTEVTTSHNYYNFNILVPENNSELLIQVNKSRYFLKKFFTIYYVKKTRTYLSNSSDEFTRLVHKSIDKSTFKYISEMPVSKQNKILNYLPQLDLPQIRQFVEVLHYNSIRGAKHNIFLDLERLKGGLFNRKIITNYEKSCINTYYGFIDSVQNKALDYGLIKAGGKIIPVVIKSSATASEVDNVLALDPKTLDVYRIPMSNDLINFPSNFKGLTALSADLTIPGFAFSQYLHDADRIYTEYNNTSMTADEFKQKIQKLIEKKYSSENLAKVKARMQKVIKQEKHVPRKKRVLPK
jgi:hypothetical protein